MRQAYRAAKHDCIGIPRLKTNWILGSFLIASLPFLAQAQGSEILPMAQLGDRGVVFEALNEFIRIYESDGIGDFNGDGFDDLSVVAKGQQGSTAAAIIIYGRKGFTGRQPLLNLVDDTPGFPGTLVFQPFVDLSLKVGPLGDLDADGHSDLFVGDDSIGSPSGRAGMAFLIYGAPNIGGPRFLAEVGTALRGTAFESSNFLHAGIGASMANIGDFNGDGEADLAFGAPSSSPEDRESAGVVFLLYRSRGLPPAMDLDQAGAAVPGTKVLGRILPREGDPGKLDPDRVGEGIVPLGDINGDGFSDFAVTNLNNRNRSIFILLGRSSPQPVIDLQSLDRGPLDGVVVLRGPGSIFSMGDNVAGIGDLNGDGFSDIAIGLARGGTTGPPGTPPQESRVHLIYGKPDFPAFLDFDALPPGLGVTIHGNDLGFFGDSFGGSLGAGDLNADGVPDILIGAPNADPEGVKDAGEAYAIFGKRDFGTDLFVGAGFDGLRMVAEGAENRLGSSIGPAGDFNGDGALDMVVLATSLDPSPLRRQRAYLVYDRGSAAAPLVLLEATPVTGPIRGGTAVLLRGTGFRGSPRVLFGDREAKEVSVLSAFELRAVTPPGAALGPVDISVTVDAETRRLAEASGFQGYPGAVHVVFGKSTFVRGDSNRDGSVDMSDAIFTLAYLFLGWTASCLDALDADDLGSLEVTDAVYLLYHLYLGGPAPPPPYPVPGLDPTPDALGCNRI